MKWISRSGSNLGPAPGGAASAGCRGLLRRLASAALFAGGIVLAATGCLDTIVIDPDGGVCVMGTACGAGCESGYLCIDETTSSVGSAWDPIASHPDALTSVDRSLWVGGYCALEELCDPTDPMACGTCGRCIDSGGLSVCYAACDPDAVDRGGCREGYRCDRVDAVCYPGCLLDSDCRAQRYESNGIASIQTPTQCALDPSSCGGSISGFDALVWDESYSCNLATGRCEHPGSVGAQGGDPCADARDCEADGVCIDDWPGGTCSKGGCEAAGNACAGSGVCQSRGVGAPYCLQGCEVGSGAGADPIAWPSVTSGCRAGYLCLWNGVDSAGMVNGGCVPGNFEGGAAPIGAACEHDGQCSSPFGNGVCIAPTASGAWVGGYCSVEDCGAPGMPTAVCGANGLCVDFGAQRTHCVDRCTTAGECRAGYGCVDLDGNAATAGDSVCWPSCGADAECRAEEYCRVASGASAGRCVSRCGNGVLEAGLGEQCDGGGPDTASCDVDCTLPSCGDGHANAAAGEACDDGNTTTEIACPYGVALCEVCDASCSNVLGRTGPYCGDGAIDGGDGEICDDGNTTTESACPYGAPSCSLCSGDCQTELALVGAYCGDGLVDAAEGEACDDGNNEPCGRCAPDCSTSNALPVGCGAGVGCVGDEDCAGTCEPGTQVCG